VASFDAANSTPAKLAFQYTISEHDTLLDKTLNVQTFEYPLQVQAVQLNGAKLASLATGLSVSLDLNALSQQALVVDLMAPGVSAIEVTGQGPAGDKTLTIGEVATVKVVTTEVVKSLSSSFFTVEHGTLGAFSRTDGKTWTATFKPNADVQDLSNVITQNAAKISDLAGIGFNDSVHADRVWCDPGFLLEAFAGWPGLDGLGWGRSLPQSETSSRCKA
jgi:hypothetical protein